MAPEASGSGTGSRSKGSALTPIESKLMKAGLAAKNQALLQKDIVEIAGGTAQAQNAINSLLRKGICQLLENKDILWVTFRSKDEAKKMGEMDPDERAVIECIKSGGDLGMWTKTITQQTGLPRHTMNKALKSLEARKLIKTVKSAKFPTRKTYMLAGVTPSSEITGGPWFTDNELDEAFVQTLRQLALKYIKDRTRPRGARDEHRPTVYPYDVTSDLPVVSDINAYIKSLEISSIELSDAHLESLLDLMVVDGDIEKIAIGKRELSAERLKEKKRQMKKRKRELEGSGDEGKKTKKGKRGALKKNGGQPARKKVRLESESETTDVDSDDSNPPPSRKKKARKDSDADDSDDDSDGGKSSKKRRRRKARAASSDEDSDAGDGDLSDVSAGSGRATNGRLDEAGEFARKYGGGIDDAFADQDDDSAFAYRWIPTYDPMLGWPDMPCGKCPVESFCAEPPGFAIHPPATSSNNPIRKSNVRRSLRAGGPLIEIGSGEMQGIGMLGGAGAAIGTSGARWGQETARVGFAVAPVNPQTCQYFQEWLQF